MRASIALFTVALIGVVGGAALIGMWALGLGIIVDSVVLGVIAMFLDHKGGPVRSPIAGNLTEQAWFAKAKTEEMAQYLSAHPEVTL